MKKIELKDTTTNRDCIELWNYLKDNSFCSLDDIKNFKIDKKWIEYRNIDSDKTSNFEYCLRKLSDYGCIEIEQKRDKGRYSASLKTIIAEPFINIDKKICTICNEEFHKKRDSAKLKDVCIKCTTDIYMTSKLVACELCGKESPKNKSAGHEGKIYHKDCKKQIIEENKKIRENKKRNVICSMCNDKLAINRSNYCRSCHNLIKEKTAKEYKCKFCGNKTTGTKRKNVCISSKCLAKHYIEIDYWKNNLSTGNNNVNIILKNILGVSCVVCNYDKFINYHHVIFREIGGKNALTNMLPLCPNHHCEVHHCKLDISEYHKKVLQRLEDIKNGLIEISL